MQALAGGFLEHLESHPSGCKWVMVPGVVGPLPNGRFMAYQWGVSKYLLTGMILQASSSWEVVVVWWEEEAFFLWIFW